MSEKNYEHLYPGVAEIAELGDQERIHFIRMDRFIAHRQATSILDELEMLYGLEDSIRPQGRQLAGYSLMGKTTIIDEFSKRHPASDNASGDAAIVPVVRVQFPEAAKDGIYPEILSALNARMPRGTKSTDMRQAAVDLLRRVGMRMLMVDEFHNVLEGSAQAQRKALNSIKYLMNELRRPVVVIGTEAVVTAVQQDTQISSRLPLLPLKRFDNDDDFLDLLAGFELLLPLRKPSVLYDPDLAAVIYQHSHGIMGNIADLLNEAAIMAIETGTERITVEEIEAFKHRQEKVTSPSQLQELLG